MKSIFQASILSAVLLQHSAVTAQDSIAAVASGVEDLSTLVSLVGTADLLSAIDGSSGSNITVFAPTNDAFDELEPSLVEALGTPAWNVHLTSILESHIVDSEIPSSAITGPMNVTMVSGEVVQVAVEPTITIDGVDITDVDIMASNGVVHLLGGGVITPTWFDQDIPTAASGVDSVSTLVSLLGTADLVDALSGDGPFTVFAPTNDAFAKLGDDVTECVTSDMDILSTTLLYHVVGAMVPAALVTTGNVTTLAEADIAIDATVLKINGESAILTPNALLANNGIVHVIDTVLVPPSVAGAIATCVDSKKTIVDKAVELDDFSTLVSLLGTAELVETLSGEGPFTVFAPTNAAFAALGDDVTACVTGDKDVLTSVLTYHVLAGQVLAADVTTSMPETVEGSTLSINATDLSINNSTATITGPDGVLASNGVIHVIDGVLVPPTVMDKLSACLESPPPATTVDPPTTTVDPPTTTVDEEEESEDPESSARGGIAAVATFAAAAMALLF